MSTRVVEGKKPYTGGEAIDINEDKVISLKLRDENNLIIYDEGDDEIYVDLQLSNEIEPTDAFPVGVNTGRVIVDNGWDKTGTLISAKTTSGDNIQLLYADDGTLWIDNGTGTFKQIYFKGDVDDIVATLTEYIDAHDTVVSDTAPSDPYEGELWYDTVNDTLKVYNGNTWVATGGGGGGSGDVVGPSSATDGHLAVFDGATGKLIKDGGAVPTGGAEIEYKTQAEYDALPSSKLTDGKHYFIYSTSGGGGRLPAEYQEVEYIDSDGSQYINTPEYVEGGHLYVAKVQYKAYNWGNFGGHHGNNSETRLFAGMGMNNTGQWCGGLGSDMIGSGTTVSLNTDYELEALLANNSQYFKVDGNTVWSRTYTFSASTQHLVKVFASVEPNNSTAVRPSSRIYYWKLYDSSNNAELDLVPCYRKADNVIGMYDLVNDTFYTNDGTGTFTKGPDVN